MLTTKKIFALLIFDLIFTLLCSAGIYYIILKPNLPFKYSFGENGILTNSFKSDKHTKILITSVNKFNVTDQDELEAALDLKVPGEKVSLLYYENDQPEKSSVILTHFYSTFYVVVCAILALTFILIGIFVYLKKQDEFYALLFHWLSLSVAGIIAFTWGNLGTDLSRATRLVFNLSYTFAPALFLHFTFSFPHNKYRHRKAILSTAYVLSGFLFTAGSAVFLIYINHPTEITLRQYTSIFNLYRIYVVLCVLTSLIIFTHSYISAPYKSEKQKMLWLVLGFIIGPGSFIILWVIPQAFSLYNPIPEEIILLMMGAIPITFAISILRYRLMNIELVINRGFVYSISLIILYTFYLLMIYIISELINTVIAKQNVISLISFGLALLLFHPVRVRVEKFVDKKFFGVRYDFRENLKNIIEEIKDIHDINLLAETIIKRINNLIHLKKIGFLIYKEKGNKFYIIAQKGLEKYNRHSFSSKHNLTVINNPVRITNKIESGIELQSFRSELMTKLDIEIVFPLISEKKTYGLLILGSKQSGLKYTVEDIDLLENIALRTASTIERIKLQQNIIRKEMEMEKLNELNKIKSFFVSSVSHDLKTPLTSIKMFTEFLKSSYRKGSKQNEYLKIIEGETDRLTRLIDNVLDITKIEKHIKEYQFQYEDLNIIVEEVLEIMEYQINISGFEINKFICEEPIIINADKDALIRSIINLIINSIKFSDKKKEIAILTYRKNESACIEIKDCGIGMRPKEIKNIFNPYYTSKRKTSHGGSGLGLTIVKHTMEAHNGSISVTSKLNEGTSFILKFPFGKTNKNTKR